MSRNAVALKDIDFSKLGQDSPLHKLMPKRRASDREHQEQVKLFQWAEKTANAHPALTFLFAVPNWFGVRTAKQGARAKAEGRKRGVPDVWFPVARGGYHGLVIEMKAGENSPTADQRRWLSFLRTAGWRTWIAYSAEEAQSVILNYLAGSPPADLKQLETP